MQKVEQRVQAIKAMKRIEVARVFASALGFLAGAAGNAMAVHEGSFKWHDPIVPLCWAAMFVLGIGSVKAHTSAEKLERSLAKLLAEREAFYVSLGRDLDKLRHDIGINSRKSAIVGDPTVPPGEDI